MLHSKKQLRQKTYYIQNSKKKMCTPSKDPAIKTSPPEKKRWWSSYILAYVCHVMSRQRWSTPKSPNKKNTHPTHPPQTKKPPGLRRIHYFLWKNGILVRLQRGELFQPKPTVFAASKCESNVETNRLETAIFFARLDLLRANSSP